MTLEPLLSIYGYPILYLGTILEGETFVIISSVLCQTGQLKVVWVVCTAFLGALTGDMFCFQMGRFGSGKFLKKGPLRPRNLARAVQLLERNPNLIILCYRFFYGFRTVIPFLIGATGCSYRRFIMLSSAGAAVWSITITAAGIVCGKALLLLMTDIKNYQLWCIAALGIIAIVFWAIRYLRGQRTEIRRGEAGKERCDR
jgi:membrane protein DedA with SNARE-associated domain